VNVGISIFEISPRPVFGRKENVRIKRETSLPKESSLERLAPCRGGGKKTAELWKGKGGSQRRIVLKK